MESAFTETAGLEKPNVTSKTSEGDGHVGPRPPAIIMKLLLFPFVETPIPTTVVCCSVFVHECRTWRCMTCFVLGLRLRAAEYASNEERETYTRQESQEKVTDKGADGGRSQAMTGPRSWAGPSPGHAAHAVR